MDSWTGQFIRQWWRYLTIGSLIRYRDVVLRDAGGRLREDRTLTLRLKSPFSSAVTLRECQADLLTFEEIFLDKLYGSVVSHLPECSSIIDLGANIGLASLYFASCYPHSRILAVEPHPANYPLLISNLSTLSDAGRARSVQAAVWNTKRTLFMDNGVGTIRFNACTVGESTDQQTNPSEVSGMPMAKIIELSGLTRIDLLKVDIEGAETQLFQGDSSWLDTVRTIAIEFHGNSRNSSGFDRLMARYGFAIREANRHTVLALRKAA